MTKPLREIVPLNENVLNQLRASLKATPAPRGHIPAKFTTPRQEDPAWTGSALKNVLTNTIKKRGSEYENIAKYHLSKNKYKIGPRTNSDHDFTMNGKQTELKGATSTKKSFIYNQIRPKQKTAQTVLMAISPHKIDYYKLSHKDIQKHIDKGTFTHQHAGKKGTDTYMYNGSMDIFKKHKIASKYVR